MRTLFFSYQPFLNIFTTYSISFSFSTVNMFFHISSVWVQDKTGNPYGQPVKYSDLLFSGVSLKKEMPIGSKWVTKVENRSWMSFRKQERIKQYLPLNRITLGQHKSVNNNRLIQLNNVICVLFRYNGTSNIWIQQAVDWSYHQWSG